MDISPSFKYFLLFVLLCIHDDFSDDFLQDHSFYSHLILFFILKVEKISCKVNFGAISQYLLPVDSHFSDVAGAHLHDNAIFLSIGHQTIFHPKQQSQPKLMQKRDAIPHKAINNDMLNRQICTIY